MKKKLIIIMLISIMTLALISCSKDKNVNKQIINDNKVSEDIADLDNDKNDKDVEEKKISKDEVIKTHEETIKRLENFYNKYNLPYYKENIWNKNVDVSELSFNSALAEQNGLDLKSMTGAKYDLTPKFTVNAALEFKWQSDMILSETIASEYCKVITDKDIDFKDIDKIIEKYLATPENNSVSENIEIDNYIIHVYMGESDRLLVTIESN